VWCWAYGLKEHVLGSSLVSSVYSVLGATSTSNSAPTPGTTAQQHNVARPWLKHWHSVADPGYARTCVAHSVPCLQALQAHRLYYSAHHKLQHTGSCAIASTPAMTAVLQRRCCQCPVSSCSIRRHLVPLQGCTYTDGAPLLLTHLSCQQRSMGKSVRACSLQGVCCCLVHAQRPRTRQRRAAAEKNR
jgi:hypothetical protein